jgi:hypothetical protein
MPPYSFHLLQLLDVGYFIVLKRAYGQLVESKTSLDVNHIDKFDFLIAYPNASVDRFKPNTIQNSSRATGLVLYSPYWWRAFQAQYLSKPPFPPAVMLAAFSHTKRRKPSNSFKNKLCLSKKRSKKAKKPTHPYRSCVLPDYQKLWISYELS